VSIALSPTDHENTAKLSFDDLSARHPGVSSGISNSYAEAVRVCLSRRHQSGLGCTFEVKFILKDNGRVEAAFAEWKEPDERTKKAWKNADDATRDGAYGLALAAIEITRGLVAVSRAETRTGADYYLGAPGASPEDLEASIRLEVSGMDEGGEPAINRRLRQKLEQAGKGCSNLPATASVVGFRTKQIVSADVKKP
jgi:hypothetical protein